MSSAAVLVDDKLALRMDYDEALALHRLLKGEASQPGDNDLLDGLHRSLLHRMKQLRKRLRGSDD